MKDMEKVFEQIGKEIAEMKEATIAREVAKKIGEMLRENGVVVNVIECTCDDVAETSFSRKYGAVISGLDFTEHDKPFLETIKKLENEIENFKNETCETCYKENLHMITQSQVDGYKNSLYMAEKNYDRLHHENEKLKQRIAELESRETETCENEPKISDSAPSREWYDNRHQSDCIEIDRLNTTIDVLIHKVEYLRQFAGLE